MSNIKREHVVPMRVLENLLFPCLKDGLRERSIEIINLFGKMALITNEEDDRLDMLGLRSSMPDNGNDPLSRYNIAGIRIVGNLSALAPTYRINRGGRGRLCCRHIHNLNVEQLISALLYHYNEGVTGPPVVSELLRSWQLGQDFLVSEKVLELIRVEI
jgi:hypothetical protein